MNSYDNILDLIPQRSPIVMVDKLLDVADKFAVSSLEVKQTNIFSKDGYLQEPGIIENIAQTAAAMTGYATKVKNQAVKLGFIGAIKGLKIYTLPKVNTTLNTTVTVQNVVMNITIINGTVKVGEEVIAECEMRIFIEE